jgi:hypothetical protein
MYEQQASFSGWAKVEVMGHQSHIGYVRTEAYGGTVLFRIDRPELPAREYTLEEPAYVDIVEGLRQWVRAGAKVQRAAVPGVSVLVGAGSIYRICPCTEEAALNAIESEVRSELKLIGMPEIAALPSGEMSDQDDEDDGHEAEIM